MKSRRQFLQMGAAVAAVAAVLPSRLRAQTAAGPQESDADAPKGLFDLHNHWISPGAYEILSTKTVGVRYVTNEKGERNLVRPGAPAPAQGPRPGGLRGTQMFDGPEARISHLDKHGVQRQLISWPTTSNVDPDLTAEEARLLWAAYNDDVGTAGLLLKAGADANAVNRYGAAPLAQACESGSAAMVKLLLDAGANPNTKEAR